MTPLGVSCALSKENSSKSVTSIESQNIGTMLPSICSQNFTPELGEESESPTSNETPSFQVPVRLATELKSSSESLSNGDLNILPESKQCKRNSLSPGDNFYALFHTETNNDQHLSVSNSEASESDDGAQHKKGYFSSQLLKWHKGLLNEYASPIASSECSTEVEVNTDCSQSGSKVVVQAMPVLDYGNISALHQCIDDKSISRKPWCELDSSSSKTGAIKILSGFDKVRVEAAKLPMSRTQDDDDDFTPSSYIMKKMEKNRSFSSHIQQGRGIKLSDIDYIASAIPETSPHLLRLIHYVLYGKYGSISNEFGFEKTKARIMHFRGFEFNELSKEYNVKCKCLTRIPYPLLLQMYTLLVRQSTVERSTMVTELLQFCLKPVRRTPASKRPAEVYSDALIEKLKSRILRGPSPFVKLKRLGEDIIQRLLNTENQIEDSRVCGQDRSKRYVKPRYIVNGPGFKLKKFPHVVEGVHNARRRIINLLHSFLFGRPGSDEVNRLNILEFNGFLQHDTLFLQRRMAVLNRYKKVELEQICDIFSLRVKGGNKIKKIKKLLFFLQAPSLILNDKRKASDLSLQAERTKEKAMQNLMTPGKAILSPPRTWGNSKRQNIKKEVNDSVKSSILKLRDFEKICLNIECAPPGALSELHDLIFFKPCDITEIHEKLLNFTPFQFDENSEEFHCRKTLLHYMGFEAVKNIAWLLDIPYCEQYRSAQELSLEVLKFLMEMKQSDKSSKKRKYTSTMKRGRKRIASDSKVRPHILMVEKDQHQQFLDQERNLESSYSGMNNLMHTSNGFHEYGKTEDGSNSKVVVQRISESSYSWTDLKTDGPITISNNDSDESLRLRDFVHHPTENQLELTIKDVICSNSLSISLGDLLNKVFHHYPKFNLQYRTDLIKSKALLILQEMEECTVDSTLDAA